MLIKHQHQSFSELKKNLLNDPEVKQEYDKLAPYFDLVDQLIELRIRKKITQKQLAELLDTKQPAIARLESGKANVTVKFLQEIANVCSVKLQIRFV